MRKNADKKTAFVLTFLLVAVILLIYAKISFSPTGFVIGPNGQEYNWTNSSIWTNETASCTNITYYNDTGSISEKINCHSCNLSATTLNGKCINGSYSLYKFSTYQNCTNSTDLVTEGLSCTYCGDSVIQAPNFNGVNEECEGNSTQACTINGYTGIQSCNSSSCTLGDCTTTESCGDGAINGNELCDGTNITSSCTDVGFDEGTLSCNTDCTLNTNACTTTTSTDTDSENDTTENEEDNEEISATTLVTSNTEGSSCTPNWDCGGWTECVDGAQDRICTDINQCGSNDGMPETSQSCLVEIKETCFDGIKNQDEKGIDCGGPCEKNCGFFTIVGSAIAVPVDAGKNFVLKGMFGSITKTIISIVSLVLIIGGAVVFVLFKKNILKISLLKKLFQKKDLSNRPF
jgi:hypothetical protein